MYDGLFKRIIEKFKKIEQIIAFCYDDKSDDVRFYSADKTLKLPEEESVSAIRNRFQAENEQWGKISVKKKFIFHSDGMFPEHDDNVFLIRAKNLFDKNYDIFFFSYDLKQLKVEESRDAITEMLPALCSEIVKANMLCYKKSVFHEEWDRRRNLYIDQLDQDVRKYRERILQFAKSIADEYKTSNGIAIIMDDLVEEMILSYNGSIEALAQSLRRAIELEIEKHDEKNDFIKLHRHSLLLNEQERVPAQKERKTSNGSDLNTKQRKTISWLNRLEDGVRSMIEDPNYSIGERVSGWDLGEVCNITAAAISDKLSKRNEPHLIHILNKFPNEWPLLRKKLKRLETIDAMAAERRRRGG